MTVLRPVEVIRAVRDGVPLAPAHLRAFIAELGAGTVPDYQASAFLMAVYLRGLADPLTTELTLAMRDSGQVIDLREVIGRKVDKHSTGGVGDKISLALAPWVAACGVPVPMVSGRGLGHTGGTLDKLAAIPGFRTDWGIAHFRRTVARLGVAMMGQTADLAPADKRLYALRDVTATVESIPLITASILAKKLAEGIDALLLDVKVGRGAFMKDLPAAERLAASLVRVGAEAGLQVRALLTRMEAPLGTTIGNALEVREAIAILQGQGPADTTELTEVLAAHMLVLGQVSASLVEARAAVQRSRDSGAALAKFAAMVEAHGGDPRVVDAPALLPSAPHKTALVANQTGFVTALDSYALGLGAMHLGAGRRRAEDTIDPRVGLVLMRQVGDPVAAGQPVMDIHHADDVLPPDLLLQLQHAVSIGPLAPDPAPLILAQVG